MFFSEFAAPLAAPDALHIPDGFLSAAIAIAMWVDHGGLCCAGDPDGRAAISTSGWCR